ncbi:aldehyde dehydrogenase family protein [Dactylosporangium sp. CA-139066]|uniref:aldehyde dehydrogenase family protein n=1 Tax=Dactylosporangium sp. CA-139066 TaxID=3239930 RepID=UPI003D8CCF87
MSFLVETPLGAGTRDVIEPATSAVLGTVGLAAPGDVGPACAAAAEAQRAWAAAPFEERAGVLRRAGALFESRAKEVEEWLVREAGSIPPKAGVETCPTPTSTGPSRPGRGARTCTRARSA